MSQDRSAMPRRTFLRTGLSVAGVLATGALAGCERQSRTWQETSGAAGSFPDLRPQPGGPVREFRRIVEAGDVEVAPGVAYRTWLYNGRYNGLEFGSYYPDAPKIFLTDNDFPGIWRGPQRVFLFAPQNLRREVLLRLPPESSYLVAEIGGRALYVNRPLTPGQPSLAQLRSQSANQ